MAMIARVLPCHGSVQAEPLPSGGVRVSYMALANRPGAASAQRDYVGPVLSLSELVMPGNAGMDGEQTAQASTRSASNPVGAASLDGAAETTTAPAALVCPACGFRVFNRRYPKCESCGAVLPESIVYSATERHSLRVADEERRLERDRNERAPGIADTSASIDDAVLSVAMALTRDV
ncbi:MAG: hypothetical protein ABI330_08800 [Caldimonas sp.]